MLSLSSQIEAILFFRAEPVPVTDLAEVLACEPAHIEESLQLLSEELLSRGVRLIRSGEQVTLATAPEMSSVIEKIKQEELAKDLGKAGAETLAIILYKGPVARAEIDHIRGVNSSYILRNLLIRGLIERDAAVRGRAVMYRPTLDLLAHLGVTSKEEMPGYENALATIAGWQEGMVAAEQSAQDKS